MISLAFFRLFVNVKLWRNHSKAFQLIPLNECRVSYVFLQCIITREVIFNWGGFFCQFLSTAVRRRSEI